jgi:hypothetical protein
MKLAVIAFLCFVSIVCYGQENMIRWSDKESLRWDDFSGKINDTSWFDAECFAEIRYNYKFYNLKNFEFDVFANFDKGSSWIRKENQSEALLKHEQLHFDIAALYSLKIKKIFETYNYTSHFLTEIQLVFNNKKQEYLSIQRRYDEETEHSLNKKKQKEWEDYISNELRQMRLKPQFVWNDVANQKAGR